MHAQRAIAHDARREQEFGERAGVGNTVDGGATSSDGCQKNTIGLIVVPGTPTPSGTKAGMSLDIWRGCRRESAMSWWDPRIKPLATQARSEILTMLRTAAWRL